MPFRVSDGVTALRRSVGRLLALGTLAATMWACQPDSSSLPDQPATATASRAACPALGLESVRIGSADGPVAFSSIGGILAIPGTDQVLVLDPSAGEVLRFDRTGSVRGLLGGAGQGPGEFARGPGLSAGLLGDSIWIQDPTLRRTSVFSPEGELLRTLVIPGGTVVEREFTVAGAIPVTNDHLLAILSWDGSPIPVPVVVLDGGGESPRVLAWLDPDDSPRAMLEVPGRGEITTVPPIRFRSLFTVTRDEPGIVLLEASRGESSYRMRWLDAEEGEVLSSYGATYDPIPVLAEERTRQVSQVVEQLSRVAVLSPAQVEAAFSFPSHYPPFERILPGPDGSVWLERSGPPGGSRWERLDREGPSGCSIELGQAERLMFVDTAGVWSRRTEPLGVPTAVFRPWVGEGEN
jgi:hypothetical protein